ncbi:MAG: CYTH and CHAD domain-containing protein [Nitrospirae bacterium]|nr:CYTH and CHAD domain-containing protein [Nitrospirota bacterium]
MMTRSKSPPPILSRIPSSTVERELKLSVDSHFRLPRLTGTPLPKRALTSTYYDTAFYDLAHARITLRYRVERGKRAWQLKVPLGPDRQEIEIPDGQAGPPAPLRELLVLSLGHRKLMPVTTLRVWRTGVRVRRGRVPVADVALDSVSVVKEACVIQRFRELEIELLQGDDGSLRSLEQRLREAGASDHDGRPKLFRALCLPAPTPAAAPAPNAPVVDHLKWALTRHVRWLLAHDPGTRLGTESESLHQMRVATRRLRAVLRAARPVLVPEWANSLQNELTWLSKFLGQARDLDVQIAYFNEEAAGLDARDRKPLAKFVTHLQTQRERVQQVVLSELRGARYLELVRRLQQAASDPSVVESPVTLHELAKRAFKKLRKVIRRMGPSPNHAKLHEVRINTKRARYAAELAVGAVGKPAARFMKRAQAVQDLLGIYQDALQAEVYIRAFLKQSTSVRAGFVAGRMVERQRQRRETVRKTMKPLLKSLLKRGKNAWG